MTKNQLIGLGIRIVGILLFLRILRDGISYFVAYNPQIDDLSILYPAYGIMAAVLLITIIFIKFPLTIAGKLLPKDGEESLKWELDSQEIYTIALTLLGLYVLVDAIPKIFYWLLFLALYNSNNQVIGAHAIGSIFELAIKFIIGIWLTLGAHGLKGFLYKLRHAGLELKK